MKYSRFLNPFTLILGVAVLLLTLISFIIRTLPAYSGNPDVLLFVGMDDPTYQLRRIEQVIANYPNVSWFDPMTFFPNGQPMHWGPLFPFIGATVCLLAGAVTRPDLISVSLFIPCVMAALMVPVVYLLVSRIADWKAGIVAAFFIAIVPGQFFFRSYYGYLDHHVGEVLFSTIFCLCYISALVYCRKHPVDIADKETWKVPALLGLLCGLAYVLGLSLMPTMILFALIVGMFTPVWFIIQRYLGHLGASALFINSITFLTAIIGFFIIGVHAEGGLNYYTIGHPIAYSLLILGNIILFGFSYQLRDKPYWYYVGVILGVTILGLVLLAVLLPDLYKYLIENAIGFFGSDDIHWKTIQEARPWTWDDAWRTFQYSLLLFGAGAAVLLYRIRKELCPSHAFTLIWALVIFYSTWQHIRYEYYLAVPVAILAGIAVGFALNLIKKPISTSSEKPSETLETQHHTSQQGPKKKTVKGHEKQSFPESHAISGPVKGISYVVLAVIIVLALLFSYQALGRDMMMSAYNLNPDWRETTEWLEKNTPDPGLDYYAIYDKKNFTYPDEAYGVMSWWDYGHIITFLGKRMPNANPFQYGVNGPNGSARFFMTQNESEANQILDNLRTKYVIADYEMDTGKFWAMSTWDDPDVGVYPYQRTFIFPNPDDPKSGVNYPILTDEYYQTMISRLFNFDGSYTEPGNVYFIEYMKPSASGLPNPVVVGGSETNYTAGKALMEAFNASDNPNHDVILTNFGYTDPVSPVSSLGHYRLIYESKSRATPAEMADLRYVKIFEYVKGATIPGDGVLELDIKTNAGRAFTYRTESKNGTFTVPYPTETTIGAITIPGKYRNVKTKAEYSITEDQINGGIIK
ncbi:oligosaccharyl transferase, archaeosortase A system-associated [Methanospirillum stamsii]|uniref:dolichyl-phosphooligosaccharide-protein glycotransferase n=1 Tax=Methanospirillum stamsii TaxID=1277351 RepID=A0A2V2NA99_9EURY|nr:oligosaccharyl transferase, archaeosortase A system-associated [Methanospirillum stamsii]PWR75670.1 oligosaccharyl transferase, archaeosortase A system-associated [Methanospirillum stamsii]